MSRGGKLFGDYALKVITETNESWNKLIKRSIPAGELPLAYIHLDYAVVRTLKIQRLCPCEEASPHVQPSFVPLDSGRFGGNPLRADKVPG
ncbi:unnamed protein product [Lupinus luteus]|uniref:Uncharacterized protein n=1 Tax=Lupinus luteus TaxID=3873 RepID=A0AAV1YBS8_LUPLU